MNNLHEKSSLRKDAETNIRKSLIRHSRVVRLCAALALTGGFVAVQQDQEAALALPAAGILATGLSGRKSRRECDREVDAYAVNTIQDKDPCNSIHRNITTKIVIADGQMAENKQFDHLAGALNSPLISVSRPEIAVSPGAMATGMIAGAISNNQYLETAQNSVFALEGVAAAGTLLAVGLSSATVRGKAYNHQLNNVDGPMGIELR